jgi:hypothetical protein
MSAPVLLALVLLLQGQPAAEPAAAPPEDRLPAGAPQDDYQFVAWCYGSLRGYLDLHDQVMPEVTRIESTYRPPDRKLSDDLKVYADMQKEGQAQLKVFQSALTAAEKASLRPINTIGAAAVNKGQDIWKVTPDVTPARLAQEWMSWALPARCETVAKSLKAKATLMGGAFKVNDAPEPPPPAAEAAPAAPTADAPNPDAPKDPVSVLLAAPPETPPAPSPPATPNP